MCGLVSIIARKFHGFHSKQLDIFEQMLVFDTLRGKDSTGVINVRRDGSVDMIKQAEQPYYMFKCQQWNTLRGRAVADGRILAGHNRAATRGEVTNENAHPFYEQNIVLMHNGTLDFGWEKMVDAKVNVDSHAICHLMTTGTPQECIPKIEGAFALMWFDLETERFHAVRNKERPLHLTITDDYYFLASEPWICNIPLMRDQVKIIDSHSIEPGELLTFDLKGNLHSEPVKLHESGSDKASMERYRTWLAQQGESWEDDLGEVLPLKQTQAMFPAARQDCSPASSTTKVCALTSTTSTTKSNNGDEEDGLTKLENTTKPLKVEVSDLPKGRKVFVKVWKISKESSGGIKWTGKVVEPGMEMYDAQGYILPRDLPGSEWARWIEFPCQAEVAWCTKTVCGISVYLRHVELLPQTFVHNGTIISEKLWQHTQEHCSCNKCGGKVEDWERNWTSVKTKGILKNAPNPISVVEVTCPECIMKALDGDYLAKYSETYYQRRLAEVQARKGQPATSRSRDAVQDREPVSGEPVGKNGSTFEVPGPSSLQ